MSGARYLVGDVFDVLATLEADSVDLVMSSPPFLALRSYLPADHPDKGKEIGSEATPADFLDTLLDVVEACDRVLAPHGSLVFELGDTYSGSGGAGGDYSAGGLRDGQQAFSGSAAKRAKTGLGDDYRPPRNNRRARPQDEALGILTPRSRGPEGRDHVNGWPLDKSLCGIPTLFAWSLAYGRNLLRPERTTPPWRIRNVIVWCRPNPPVGALGDKVRPATSYLTVATKARDRYFDLDAVRTEPVHGFDWAPGSTKGMAQFPGGGGDASRDAHRFSSNPAGAPPLDYWVIPTQPYEGSHYATFPERLCEIPVKAMCPPKVCRVCGQPSRRIVRVDGYTDHGGVLHPVGEKWSSGIKNGAGAHSGKPGSRTTTTTTTGWTDCECDWPYLGDQPNRWRTGLVLDPFAGSGTTLQVATGHGRDAVGIDIDHRNAQLAVNRVGPLLLTVETPEATAC